MEYVLKIDKTDANEFKATLKYSRYDLEAVGYAEYPDGAMVAAWKELMVMLAFHVTIE